jgi:hypothetical protein
MSGDRWPDDMRLSDLGPRFICSACGKCDADVRPDFNWNKQVSTMGHRLNSLQIARSPILSQPCED